MGVNWLGDGSNSGFKAVTAAIQLDEAFNRYKSIFFPHATDPVPDPSQNELVVDVLVPRLIRSCPSFPLLVALGVKHGHKQWTCRMRRLRQSNFTPPKKRAPQGHHWNKKKLTTKSQPYRTLQKYAVIFCMPWGCDNSLGIGGWWKLRAGDADLYKLSPYLDDPMGVNSIKHCRKHLYAYIIYIYIYGCFQK